jgi:hypothetical protein
MSNRSSQRGVKGLGYLAIFAILVYGVFLFVPQSVPLLDANRQVLAESPREGYCAGVVFIQTRGYGSAEQMALCLDEDQHNGEKNWDMVQSAFCDAVLITASMPKSDCMTIVGQQRFWPTMMGTITNAWNKSFPYPGQNALDAGTSDDSRTGDRETNDRIGEYRP